MSDYSQLTHFLPKDSLATGDINKLIKGADLDPELAGIAVAVRTKYDPSDLNVTLQRYSLKLVSLEDNSTRLISLASLSLNNLTAISNVSPDNLVTIAGLSSIDALVSLAGGDLVVTTAEVSADLSVDGNITVIGTVDGRSIVVDGDVLDGLVVSLSNETAARKAADTALGNRINALPEVVHESTIDNKIAVESAARLSADLREASTRETTDNTLASSVTIEVAAREDGDTALGLRIERLPASVSASSIDAKIAVESAAREEDVEDLEALIDEEEAARRAADSVLSGRILSNMERGNLTASVQTSNERASTAADIALGVRITDAATVNASTHQTLQGTIDSLVSPESPDSGLTQGQVDARIDSRVENFAETASSATIPAARFGDGVITAAKLAAGVTTSGPAGADGEDGAAGPAGARGTAGAAGPPGAAGATGVQGSDGAIGPRGVQGSTGSPGARGAAGTDGEGGDDGVVGAAGEDGTDGVTGAAGATGAVGPRGTSGTDGRSGADGTDGLVGDRGQRGVQGLQGEKGATGARGPQGVPGTGTDGMGGTGEVGPKGDKGDAGPTGPAGADGEDGTDGTTGARGQRGDTGTSGTDGADGSTGPQGSTGSRGGQGPRGLTGSQGQGGSTGPRGTDGSTGPQGPQGDQGPAGTGTGGTSTPNATTSTRGKIEIATNAEALTGTDTSRAVTAAGVKSVVDRDTPNATVSKRGLVELANQSEARAGTDTEKAMTPQRVKDVVGIATPGASENKRGLSWFATDAEIDRGATGGKVVLSSRLKRKTDQEIAAREAADTALGTRITDAAATAATAHQALQTNIDNATAPTAPSSGLTQGQVDNRISAKVENFAETGSPNIKISSSRFGTESIPSGVLGNNSVHRNNIQNNSVTSSKIVSGAVTADKIASGVIPADQSQAVAANTAKTGITSPQAAAITTNTAKRSYPTSASTKLATIETNAKDDQTAAEINTLLEAVTIESDRLDASAIKNLLKGGGLLTVPTVYKTAGTSTFTKNPDAKFIVVECFGGSGGGGGGFGGIGDSRNGFGGAGGQYIKKTFLSSAVENTTTITVGVLGTGGPSISQSGSDGGASSFGSLVSAAGGGGGGRNTGVAGRGGFPDNCDICIYGEDGVDDKGGAGFAGFGGAGGLINSGFDAEGLAFVIVTEYGDGSGSGSGSGSADVSEELEALSDNINLYGAFDSTVMTTGLTIATGNHHGYVNVGSRAAVSGVVSSGSLSRGNDNLIGITGFGGDSEIIEILGDTLSLSGGIEIDGVSFDLTDEGSGLSGLVAGLTVNTYLFSRHDFVDAAQYTVRLKKSDGSYLLWGDSDFVTLGENVSLSDNYREPDTITHELFMIGGVKDYLSTLNITTGVATRVGSSTRFGISENAISGLGFHNGLLYTVGLNTDYLAVLDTTTGIATRVGSSTKFGINEGSARGLASHNGKLYMVGGDGDYLSILNTTTGVATRVGNSTRFGIGETSPSGIASHNGKLYMVGALRDYLTVLNITTGAATRVGSSTKFGINEGSATGLASHLGKLYLVGFDNDYLSTLNTTTGAATRVGNSTEFGIGETVPEGITSVPITTPGKLKTRASGGLIGVPSVYKTAGTSTWTKNADTKFVVVECFGGPGGGGPGIGNFGGGGGGGQYIKKTFSANELGSTETIIVGAVGTGGFIRVEGGRTTETEGTDGTDSHFGSLIRAKGGEGGNLAGALGLGGSGDFPDNCEICVDGSDGNRGGTSDHPGVGRGGDSFAGYGGHGGRPGQDGTDGQGPAFVIVTEYGGGDGGTSGGRTRFVTDQVDWVANIEYAYAHGLGETPTNFWGQIICTEAFSGKNNEPTFVAGDTWQFSFAGSHSRSAFGIVCYATPTHIAYTSERAVMLFKAGKAKSILAASLKENFKIKLYAEV